MRTWLEHLGPKAQAAHGCPEGLGDAPVHRDGEVAGTGVAAAGPFAGCHTIVLRDVNTTEMLEPAVERRVTHLGAVPAILQLMVMTPGVEDMDFPPLQYVLYGASPITAEVLTQAMQTFDCKFKRPHTPIQNDDPGAPNDSASRVGTFMNARAGTICAGASEVQRNIIGELLLGLPKEPRGSERSGSSPTLPPGDPFTVSPRSGVRSKT